MFKTEEPDYSAIGPIRIVPCDQHGYRTDRGPSPVREIGPAVSWMMLTTHPVNHQYAYVIVPFPQADTDNEWNILARCDLENGLNTLAYLIAHPEVKEI